MPVNHKMMANMKKEYGEKKGKNVYYATENKMKRSMHGSGTFTKAEQDKGYKVMATASELYKMCEEVTDMPHTLASRRTGGRAALRRSESTRNKKY